MEEWGEAATAAAAAARTELVGRSAVGSAKEEEHTPEKRGKNGKEKKITLSERKEKTAEGGEGNAEKGRRVPPRGWTGNPRVGGMGERSQSQNGRRGKRRGKNEEREKVREKTKENDQSEGEEGERNAGTRGGGKSASWKEMSELKRRQNRPTQAVREPRN